MSKMKIWQFLVHSFLCAACGAVSVAVAVNPDVPSALLVFLIIAAIVDAIVIGHNE